MNKMVEQRGVPVFRPSESKAAESFRRRTGRKPIVLTPAQIAAGVGSGVSRGSVSRFLKEKARQEAARKAAEEAARKAAEEKARQEAARRAAEEKARQEAARRAAEERARKAAMEKRARHAREQRALREKLRMMSVVEKKQFFREEAERAKAKSFIKLQERGKRLTPKAQELLTKVQKRVGISEPSKEAFLESRQIDTVRRKGREIPIMKTFFVDPTKKIDRPATAEEEKTFREAGKELIVPEEPKELITKTEIGRERLRQKILRGKKLSAKEHAEIAALTAAGVFIEVGLSIKNLPKLPGATLDFAKRAIKDPSTLKEIPEAIQRGGAEFGRILRVSPTEAIAKVGTELLILKGTGKILKVTGSLGSKAVTRLSPKFRKVAKSVISIPSKQKGKVIRVKIGGAVQKLKEPLRKQVRLAGKEVTAVSAQADELVRFIRRKRIVRKPIPNEAGLSKASKELLDKFDKAKINKRELIRLDNLIRKETKGAGSLLERSFFADPRGRLRPSRLGLKQKEASLLDVLSGDVTFKAQKPQVLIFEKIEVQKFPKALKGIEKKLKAGKVLTRSEANKLLQFQLKKSGKFKPVGALTKEPEITLAPGEIVKREKTIAVTLIEGKRVPIVSAKIVKAKSATKKLLQKASKGKLTASELKKLRSALRKETGFETSFSRGRMGRKVFPIKRKITAAALRRVPKRKVSKRKITKRVPKIIPRKIEIITRKPRKAVKRIKRRIPKKPRKAVKRVTKKAKRIPKRVKKAVPRKPKKVIRRIPKKAKRVIRGVAPRRRPPRISEKIVPRLPSKKKRLKKARRKQRSYNVFSRPLKKTKKGKKPKLIRINKVPLSKTKAEDLRNYISDTSLSRTASIKPVLGKPGKPRLKVPRRYAVKTKRKFRTYRIVKGKRKPLRKGKVIERRKHLLDTKQEKRQITLKRRLSQLEKQSKIKKRLPSRKINKAMMRKPIRKQSKKQSFNRITNKAKRKPTSEQLKNLAKGRKIRMENLNRRKK